MWIRNRVCKKLASEAAVTPEKEEKLGIIEKYLTVWIVLCIAIGLLLGKYAPSVGKYLDSLKFGQISIPIGVLLFFMMYPTILGIAFSDIKKAAKQPRPIMLAVFANWVISPILMTILANVFLAGHPDYIAGIILLGISPCTAMVMWWMLLAKGDMAQGLINTAVNATLMIILYAPLAAFYLGVSGIPVPWDLVAMSVILFIFLPVLSGAATRKILIPRKGIEWFDHVYREGIGKISFIALLLTLVVLFSLQGNIILSDPLLVLYIAVPNFLGYAIMISWTYLSGWYVGWKYETAIDVTLIGSSSNFEVAIAVATTLYGIGSGAALSTVIGPLFEVPLMLSLVRFGLATRKYFPRDSIKKVEKQ